MASISWLDKIPPLLSPLLSLTQHPFLAQELSFNFITQQGRFMPCHICLSFVPRSVHVNLTKSYRKERLVFKTLVVLAFPGIVSWWHQTKAWLEKFSFRVSKDESKDIIEKLHEHTACPHLGVVYKITGRLWWTDMLQVLSSSCHYSCQHSAGYSREGHQRLD